MNIIFFTNISTFPYNGGEKLRSYYLLKALSDLGHTVHAVIRNEEEADLARYPLPNVAYHIHPKKPLAVSERLTGSHYFTKSATVLQLFEQICREHQIDAAVLDYGYVGHYIGFSAGAAFGWYWAHITPSPRYHGSCQPAALCRKSGRCSW